MSAGRPLKKLRLNTAFTASLPVGYVITLGDCLNLLITLVAGRYFEISGPCNSLLIRQLDIGILTKSERMQRAVLTWANTDLVDLSAATVKALRPDCFHWCHGSTSFHNVIRFAAQCLCNPADCARLYFLTTHDSRERLRTGSAPQICQRHTPTGKHHVELSNVDLHCFHHQSFALIFVIWCVYLHLSTICTNCQLLFYIS